MIALHTIRTARLTLAPVSAPDLPDLVALKEDPVVFGQMLGGIRSPWQAVDELAEDITTWSRFGAGMFAIHEGRKFQGITGIQERPDGRGLALRFAVWPEARGRGLHRAVEAQRACRRIELRRGVTVALRRGRRPAPRPRPRPHRPHHRRRPRGQFRLPYGAGLDRHDRTPGFLARWPRHADLRKPHGADTI